MRETQRETPSGVLKGLERKLIFNRLRAAIGLRWELPRLLDGVEVPPGSRCLEVGTGLGWGTLGLIQYTNPAQVIATDYDGMILPAARSYLSQHNAASRVAFCQADVKHLPFADQTFDLVLALYVIHHVFGHRLMLTEIGRVTKPRGWFLFVDSVRPNLIPNFRGRSAPEGVNTREEFTGLLAEAGFHIERWRGLPFWALVVARNAKKVEQTRARSL